MTKFKKASAVFALTAASTLAILGGQALVSHVQYARADADHTATMQRALLEAEGVVFDDNGLVDMKRFLWPITIWEVQDEFGISKPVD